MAGRASDSAGDNDAALVGRSRERAVLRDALAAALAGRGSLVVIGGEAGIGKTALAEWALAEAAARGATVPVGRCYDLSETPPYGPWQEAFARLPARDDLSAPPDFAGGGGAASQAAFFDQVRDYLAALAGRRPLVLLLDDLHWADPASLDLLRVLGRHLAGLPLLLLATYRADELTRRHPLYQLLPLLVREARAARLDLHPLDEAELRVLVAGYGLPDAATQRLVAYLRDRAEGNPFFAGELLRALEEGGALRREPGTREAGGGWALGDLGAVGVPPLLRQVLDARLDRLGDDARALLAVAAVIGQEVPFALWQAVADADEGALLAVVERATAAHLLAELPDGSGVRFAHALVREALYEGTLALRRRGLHRRAGEALLALPHPDPDAVAYHFQRAGDPRAADWLLRAGERAQRAYAWLTAAERFEAALALLGEDEADAGERGWLLLRLGRLRRFADPRQGIGTLDEALRVATRAGDPALASCALLNRGQLHCYAGDIRRGLADIEAGADARDALPAAGRARLAARLRAFGVATPGEDVGRGTLTAWLAIAGRYAEALAMAERVIAATTTDREDAPLSGPDADAFYTRGVAHSALGRPGASRAGFGQARALFLAVGHHHLIFWAALCELIWAVLPYQTTDLAARRQLEAAMSAARARTDGVGAILAAAPALLLLEGRWGEADRAARAVLDAGSRFIFDAQQANQALALLARARGDADLARALVRAAGVTPAADPGGALFAETVAWQRLAAALALDAGDLDEAYAWLAAHDRWLAWSGAVLWRAEGWLGWAAYHRAAGDLAAAREATERALGLASEPRQPLALLAAHRLRAELALAESRHGAAAAHLAAALALSEACAAPYERALTLLALAELRLATGDREGAGASLVDARAILEPLGARPTLVRADALAARLTAPASPPAASVANAVPFGLTAREAEVLRLVAAGLGNLDIADRLSLSRRTVEQHLRSVYDKLGVENRTAAARLAVERGLT